MSTIDLQNVCRRMNRLRPLRFLNAKFAEFGDTFETELPDGTRRIATRSPAVTLEMLVKQADAFTRIDNPIAPLLLDGLLIVDGPLWRRRRTAFQPSFTKRAISSIRTRLQSSVRAYVDEIPSGDHPDGYDIFRDLVLKVTVESLFSFQAYDRNLLDVLADTMALTGPQRIDGTRVDDTELWKRTQDGLRDQVEQILQAPNRAPFLAELMESGLTRDEVAVELRSVLLGGQDTSSSVLLWAMRLDKGHAPVQQVISETLRLHTPLYAYPRVCTRKANLGPIVAEAGDEVVSWIHTIHRDARFWPDPLAFLPERFEHKPQPGTYLPFSLGYHNCLGKHFARLLLEEALTALRTRDFDWKSGPPRVVPLITMHPSDKSPVRVG